jgi:hypothetical protein
MQNHPQRETTLLITITPFQLLRKNSEKLTRRLHISAAQRGSGSIGDGWTFAWSNFTVEHFNVRR